MAMPSNVCSTIHQQRHLHRVCDLEYFAFSATHREAVGCVPHGPFIILPQLLHTTTFPNSYLLRENSAYYRRSKPSFRLIVNRRTSKQALPVLVVGAPHLTSRFLILEAAAIQAVWAEEQRSNKHIPQCHQERDRPAQVHPRRCLPPT